MEYIETPLSIMYTLFGSIAHVNIKPVHVILLFTAKALQHPLQELIALSTMQSNISSPGAKSVSNHFQ